MGTHSVQDHIYTHTMESRHKYYTSILGGKLSKNPTDKIFSNPFQEWCYEVMQTDMSMVIYWKILSLNISATKTSVFICGAYREKK